MYSYNNSGRCCSTTNTDRNIVHFTDLTFVSFHPDSICELPWLSRWSLHTARWPDPAYSCLERGKSLQKQILKKFNVVRTSMIIPDPDPVQDPNSSSKIWWNFWNKFKISKFSWFNAYGIRQHIFFNGDKISKVGFIWIRNSLVPSSRSVNGIMNARIRIQKKYLRILNWDSF